MIPFVNRYLFVCITVTATTTTTSKSTSHSGDVTSSTHPGKADTNKRRTSTKL